MEWTTGEPPKHGFYLGAWRSNNPLMHEIIVSELWFNPDATPKWWFTRGYTGQSRSSSPNDSVKGEVISWMPMPDPPKDVAKWKNIGNQ